MPFGYYDPQGLLFEEARKQDVGAIVILNDRLECLQKAGRDLEQFYVEQGLQVVALPIRNYDAVSAESMDRAVGLAVEHAEAGRHLLVHCSLGIGRTGMFGACMAHQVLGLDGDEALRWIRKHISGAVETRVQEDLVRRFAGNGRGGVLRETPQ
jgi:protein-tyrosine phosphatase